jgi:signal transduction histidine kinase/CheY-like chemotaxis protein
MPLFNRRQINLHFGPNDRTAEMKAEVQQSAAACQIAAAQARQPAGGISLQGAFGSGCGSGRERCRSARAEPASKRLNFRRYRTVGIQARLMLLSAVTALPLLVLAGVDAIGSINAERMQLKNEVAGKVGALTNDIDRQISAIQTELKVLATLPSIQSGDLAAFDRQLHAAVQVYGNAFVLHDTRGQQLINTLHQFGEPLPRAINIADVHRVVATALPQVSDLITGTVLRRPIISVRVPVMRDGHVAYVLSMGIKPEIMSGLLSDQNLLSEAISPAWTIAVIDRNGIILARNRELAKFLGRPVAPLLRNAMVAGAADNWVPNITSDGTPVYSTFRRSSITGWTVAIGVPQKFVDAPLRRAWMLAVTGGILFLILSLVLAYWVAQAIRRPVEKLAAMTKAMGDGAPLVRLSSGVRELNLVGDGLCDAAAALAEHRENLEERVAQRTRELACANNQLREEIEAREVAQATLLQTQKMEAIGQLTGGIAHDFNNLLMVASGSLDMLEERIAGDRNLRLLRNAQAAISRGASLTRSLLAFARKQRLEPVRADLNAVITEMTEMLRLSIGPAIEIQHSLAADLWPVLIDVGQIQTALLNIAINARDAMPEGGTLSIKTANIEADLPKEIAAAEGVLVTLSDTGTGMSRDVIERACDPFFTTKEPGKGTGLGLSMVLGMVQQSGGAVRLHSRVGHGTAVLIYLPRAAGEVSPAYEGPSSADPRGKANARILVVDDDPMVRGHTSQCLRTIGYSTIEADSGRAALSLIKSGEPCDLVVIDEVMPGLSGQATVRRARRANPELKVLFLSGCARQAAAGADVWLKKPCKARMLAEAVSRALQ